MAEFINLKFIQIQLQNYKLIIWRRQKAIFSAWNYLLISSNNDPFFSGSLLSSASGQPWRCCTPGPVRGGSVAISCIATSRQRFSCCCAAATEEVCCCSLLRGEDVKGPSSTWLTSMVSRRFWPACRKNKRCQYTKTLLDRLSQIDVAWRKEQAKRTLLAE